MSLNCLICKLAFKRNQHKTHCISCKCNIHRICMTQSERSNFHTIKINWTCDLCKSRAFRSSTKLNCFQCQKKLPNSNLCFDCFFPPFEIHELFHSNDFDFIDSIQFLFQEKTIPHFQRGFRVGYLNTNSLTNKYHEITQFLTENKI